MLTFTATGVNIAGSFVLVVSNAAGAARLTVDDVEWTGYSGSTDPYEEWVAGQGEDPETPEFAPEGDADGDGRTNYEEYMADTDPGDSNVTFEVSGDYANGTLNSLNVPGEVRIKDDWIDSIGESVSRTYVGRFWRLGELTREVKAHPEQANDGLKRVLKRLSEEPDLLKALN